MSRRNLHLQLWITLWVNPIPSAATPFRPKNPIPLGAKILGNLSVLLVLPAACPFLPYHCPQQGKRLTIQALDIKHTSKNTLPT